MVASSTNSTVVYYNNNYTILIFRTALFFLVLFEGTRRITRIIKISVMANKISLAILRKKREFNILAISSYPDISFHRAFKSGASRTPPPFVRAFFIFISLRIMGGTFVRPYFLLARFNWLLFSLSVLLAALFSSLCSSITWKLCIAFSRHVNENNLTCFLQERICEMSLAALVLLPLAGSNTRLFIMVRQLWRYHSIFNLCEGHTLCPSLHVCFLKTILMCSPSSC